MAGERYHVAVRRDDRAAVEALLQGADSAGKTLPPARCDRAQPGLLCSGLVPACALQMSRTWWICRTISSTRRS
jgi:hypothetical protein